MSRKKDLVHLHVRITPITATKLKSWAEELGFTIGETIDNVVENYEDYCNDQDNELEKESIQSTLARLVEKVDELGKKIDEKSI